MQAILNRENCGYTEHGTAGRGAGILTANGIQYTVRTTKVGGTKRRICECRDLTRALHGSIKFMCIRRIRNMHSI